ncbi:hypothetical protein ANCCEY_12392 [Ancylostoma ceylanicum]|uniref:Uncharacterized protein n=1 Tax=Ancylostoma ceylanicum TaxID=53326 RepID=A0A0D6LLL8_9BILA|nr:hypothetical protein ANCCEY_12392 [Ancylostoma ceylanicum]
MDAIVAVCDLYRSELDDCVATLRNRGLLISERSSQHKRRGMSDSKTRFMLLTAALMQGITSGYVIDSTYISGEPLGFVTPLAIVMAYLGEVASVYKNRGALFVACATSALIANLGIGMLLNAITKTYELMTFAYVAAGLMTMKLVLKNVHRPGTGHSQQFFLLQSFTLIRALTFLICGYYKYVTH